MELQEKNTVVTGAANGIGKAVAEEFHKQGARVVLADRDAALLNSAVEKLNAKRPNSAFAVACDLSTEAANAELVANSKQFLGFIDLFYANAGVAMGTEGMKASLISREIIADSIELVSMGHSFDGIVCLTGCDKTSPGAAMALGRLNIPGLVLYNGTILPGSYKGKDVTVQSVFEAVGSYNAGKITAEELWDLENAACPGAGACGGQFTANTMSMALEVIGLSPAGLNGIPATDPDKIAAAERSGEIAVELVRKNLKPRDIVTGKALENAIRAVGATAGSTNAVLHLLAIAREFNLPLEIEAFERLGESTPVIGNLIPGGSYAALDLYKAGGIALVLRELAAGGLLHLNEQGVDGRTMGEIASQANERAGQDVIRPINNPIKKTGGLTVLRGSLAPAGAARNHVVTPDADLPDLSPK